MTLDQLRLDFVQETAGIERLTTSSPPIVHTVQESGGHYEVIEEAEPADANGRNLSAAMVTLIGSITAELNFYPPRYPVRRALAEWERTCRRRHRGSQWWDHASAPICGDMLRAVIEGGVTPYWAIVNIGHLGETWSQYKRGERLIGSGAAFVTERLQRWENEGKGACEKCGRGKADHPKDHQFVVHDRSACVVCREEAG